MTHVPDWPWVRTQIHPDAQHAAWQVRWMLGWTLPGVYAAAIHYMLMAHTPTEAAEMIRLAIEADPHVPEEEEVVG